MSERTDTAAEATAAETKKRKRSSIPRSEKKLRRELMECVLGVVRDAGAKPAERLTAVKTMMDYFLTDGGESGEVRIVFENLPDGWAE